MVLTEEEKKERQKEYNKKYRKNNKERKKQTQKLYREKNKEKLIEKKKEYYKNNKEKYKEYRKTPSGKKSETISNWKTYGLIDDDYEGLYDKYLNTTECEICKYVFDNTNWKCMDHCHTTGLFRQILCFKCNVHDNWKNKKNYLEH